MNRKLVVSFAWAVVSVLWGCDNWRSSSTSIPTAEEIRTEALKQAKRQNKNVLLWFVDSNSIWSDRLDDFHADADVANVLKRYLVLARVHIRDTPGGEQLYLETGGNRGAPAYSLLDSNGALLADSGSDEEHNIGYPTKPFELEAFRDAIEAACPEITKEEVRLLHEKLIEIRLRHEPDAP